MRATVRLIIVLALTSFTANPVTSAEPLPSGPGIVTEKPESGRFVEVDGGFMVPYEVRIPGTELRVRMQPVPAGEYMMGSPDSEPGRDELEGPQRKVVVQPFWMAEHETTWAEYKQFMNLYQAFKAFERKKVRVITEENEIDAITAPTKLYEAEFTFEYGEDPQQAAVTMTQYAAKQYTKWLSAVTESQFRLPTEAEWEYACRAGASTAYFFGDDPSELGDYAWFADNTEEGGQRPVAQKKPNAWGLFDMLGNVAEWTLDGLEKYPADKAVTDAARDWVRTEELDPRVVRGGSWEFPAEQCRCAARLGSDSKAWREYDPNLPKSPWWFTTDPARGVGFRIIRPLQKVSREEMETVWAIDNEETEYDVADRLSEGRGVRGLVDKDLPAAVKALDDE
ncbi:MAG: SUMF1/EgtB/PvdO family nonheme iron enzyme [Planctomycetaceae bacterium]